MRASTRACLPCGLDVCALSGACSFCACQCVAHGCAQPNSESSACSVRLRFSFHRYLEEKPYRLRKVELFQETYQGPYDGGRQLPMSCGAEKGLSVEPALDQSAAEEAARGAGCDAGRLRAWIVLVGRLAICDVRLLRLLCFCLKFLC